MKKHLWIFGVLAICTLAVAGMILESKHRLALVQKTPRVAVHVSQSFGWGLPEDISTSEWEAGEFEAEPQRVIYESSFGGFIEVLEVDDDRIVFKIENFRADGNKSDGYESELVQVDGTSIQTFTLKKDNTGVAYFYALGVSDASETVKITWVQEE